jgi:uncharacterized protein YutE (UPF0331/DUF86 family)
MIDRDTFAARLDRLREYLRQLDSIKTRSRTEFANDPILRAAGERYLHLAMESALDIGNHIIAERGYQRPDTYAGVFAVLAEQGVLSGSLFRDLEGMAAFRNLLVHDYARLDHGRVYDVLRDKHPVLQSLYECYANLLNDDSDH